MRSAWPMRSAWVGDVLNSSYGVCMRGVTGLALILAVVLLMLGLGQVLLMEATVTSLTGSFAEFLATIPTLIIFMVATVAVFVVVGYMGMFLSRRG